MILALYKVIHKLGAALFCYSVTDELEYPRSNVCADSNRDSIGVGTLKLGGSIAHAIQHRRVQGLTTTAIKKRMAISSQRDFPIQRRK